MKINDLIQLLNNRLREFKLSGDYARMNGDLERMNAADKEVIALEDTLYKLNLLLDTSKSAAVKKAILAEIMTDGSVAVLGEYDITPYATDPEHEEKIMNILSKMAVMDTVEKIDDYIKGKYLSSPVTGEMIMSAALAYEVDTRLMMAIMEQDSRFGTVGVAVRTFNPGNVGNNDDGDTVTYESWQEGVTAVAEWLNRHRASKIISEIPDTATSTPATATSTSSQPEAGEAGQATSTPPIITTTAATSTPTTATSTQETATTTPPTATSTPTMATSTPTTATSTPPTATSTPETTPEPEPTPEPTATTTPETATSTEETIPVTTSTTTTATTTSEIAPIATSTPQTTNQTIETAITTQETASTSSPQSADSTAN